ncbi:hypothetical protein FOQG_17962 [Fusarium oxysporum f. sp. raphani 54005]|uniref:Uncharacterized protein n=1 Tax=Fusarium oxysporum f. sp. raphani 54005 TaxID=1089458 RepID=X0B6D9_FUSOX|nr:hypothetical protein FOQG_17962 [Fusarium oxysporum f. sp. raphani 54005]
MASQAPETSVSWTNNAFIGSFASKPSWNFNAFFYRDYPDKHLQVEFGPKRRKTKRHRAYVCLHCQNPPWSNRVPGNAIHQAETAHRAFIRASKATNNTPSSTFASSVSSGAIDSYIVSHPSQAALRNCLNKQAYIEAVEYSELRFMALASCREPSTTQSKINISSDLWTSPHRHGVLAVRVQWVDEDYKLQKALLGLPEGAIKILEVESGTQCPHKRRRIRCIGHIINLALQAFLLARSKVALRASLEATADEPGSTMLEEFSQQLHELDLSEIAAHSDTTTQQEQQQEERQEKPTRRSINAKDKRAATTHQQASNNDKRFAGWHGIPALAKLHVLAVYIRGSALHTGNDQWYDAIGKQLGIHNITRWSSWHRVITIALNKKPQIIQFTAENDNDLEGNTLSSRDWEMLERTLEFLQSFYEATLEAEGAMSSISQSLELLSLILGHCEKWKVCG